jgi:GNAT superfamily N-acetyltransferase
MDGITIEQLAAHSTRSGMSDVIIKALPEWFGEQGDNQNYIDHVRGKDAFAAYVKDEGVGLIALKYHFDTTAEIWWLGLHPHHHNKGIGTMLFERAREHALSKGCRHIIVNTVSDRSPDMHYAKTRDFYFKQGFRALFEFNEHDHPNPMMCMILDLSGG